MQTPDSTQTPPPDRHWLDAGGGYQLALDGEKLVCRNAKGKVLASLPKEVRDGELAESLSALTEWLAQHAAECRETVEAWMLRSLPVPRGVIALVYADPAWRTQLENAVLAPVAADGTPDLLSAGFLRTVDAARGLGIVDLDGETRWLATESVALPHPILLGDLADFRALAGELGLRQGLSQLYRETFAPGTVAGKPVRPDRESIDAFEGGEFEQLLHVLGHCRRLGYRVRGGHALCRVYEAGAIVEARFWVGDGDPQWETSTGDLTWVDAQDRAVEIGRLGPIAWSEGVRMAAAIHALRKVDEEENNDDA